MLEYGRRFLLKKSCPLRRHIRRRGFFMSISKKIRFEVFKRDNFTCGYCGRKPPEVILEIDHINPKSKGGIEDINNFITACFDCNRGKKNIRLDKIPPSLQENLEVLKEKEIQLKEYNKFITIIERRLKKEMQEVNDIYTSYFPEWKLSDNFINATLKRFFKFLLKQEIIQAMHIACSKITDSEKSINYFCGICWNKIKKNDLDYKIKREWKRLSSFYHKGIGYFKESDIQWIITSNIPIEVIKNSMVEILTKKESCQSYWKALINLLEEKIKCQND